MEKENDRTLSWRCYFSNLWAALLGRNPLREEMERVRQEHEKNKEDLFALKDVYNSCIDIMDRDAKRIAELERQIAEKGTQIAEKDKQIASLQELVESLRGRVREKEQLVELVQQEYQQRMEQMKQDFDKKLNTYSEELDRVLKEDE